MTCHWLLLLACAAALALPNRAQAPANESKGAEAASHATRSQPPVDEARVAATVGWLADDERNGRGTGSVELDAAAQWLAQRFAAAGLEQVRDGTWFHQFSLPASRLWSDAVELTLERRIGDERTEFFCSADADVRHWLPGEVRRGERDECTVVRADDPALQSLLRARSARRLIVIEVPEDHAYWRAAGGEHLAVTETRRGSRPVLLLRSGVLPEAKAEGEAMFTATWSVVAPDPVEVPQHNVVGLHRGTDLAHEVVVVSAHYDHLGTGPAVEGDSIYNGADDNATGTAAVVLLAEQMAGKKTRRSVLFVCFAAEERGLVGSRAFCQDPPLDLTRVVANLNLEMLGRPLPGNEGKAWVTGAELSDFADVAGAALGRAGIERIEFPPARSLFWASDNAAFVGHGIVAHSISAGSLHADYHQPSDEHSRIDVPHMTRVVRGLEEVVLELANRPTKLAYNQAGQAAVERARRR